MEIIKVSSNLKLITLFTAIAISATSATPAWSQNSKKSTKPVPEIGWSSRISSMGLDEEDNIGKKYHFYCQAAEEDLIHAPVWGTKTYTVNSGICSTAVHAGMLDPETGGKVTIKLVEGQNFYTGSDKNDVISKDHRSTNLSFSFVGKKKVVAQNPNPESETKKKKKKSEPSALERVLMDGVQRGVERTIERTITDLLY